MGAGIDFSRGIQVDDASMSADGLPLLTGVSFHVRPGRVTALVGPNGAGKSSLLRAILGLAHLDSGTATIGGHPLVHHPAPAATVGAMLGSDGLHAGRTAAGHLRVIAAAAGLERSAIGSALVTVGLGHLAGLRIAEMSLGMRQRLSLAGALLASPQVLILDEPHNGLDASAIRWLRTVLEQYSQAGRTVLISSHLLGELETVADDIIALADGRLVAAGAREELTTNRNGRVSVEQWYFSVVESS